MTDCRLDSIERNCLLLLGKGQSHLQNDCPIQVSHNGLENMTQTNTQKDLDPNFSGFLLDSVSAS